MGDSRRRSPVPLEGCSRSLLMVKVVEMVLSEPMLFCDSDSFRLPFFEVSTCSDPLVLAVAFSGVLVRASAGGD